MSGPDVTHRWIMPTGEPAPFDPAYFATVFVVPEPPAAWPRRFAIVTAHNPFGRVAADELNRANADALARRLGDLEVPSFVVTGASPDLQHREEGRGFAVPDLATAYAVSAQFDQAAYFFVEDGTVFVCVDASGRGWEVGEWCDRVVPRGDARGRK